MNTWLEALRKFNADRSGFTIPKKGTPEYKQIKKLMKTPPLATAHYIKHKTNNILLRRKHCKKQELVGSGILQWLKNSVNVLSNPSKALSVVPKQVTDFLVFYGNHEIIAIEIVREPINQVVKHLINLSTRGDLLTKASKFAYDDIFHLSCRLTLKDKQGKLLHVRAEKNARVAIGLFTPVELKPGGARMKIPSIPSQLLLNTFMLKDARENTFVYDAVDWNCQRWVTERLQVNGMLSPELHSFINQSVQELIPGTTIKQFMKATTNIANIFDNIMHGGSMMQHQKQRF